MKNQLKSQFHPKTCVNLVPSCLTPPQCVQPIPQDQPQGGLEPEVHGLVVSHHRPGLRYGIEHFNLAEEIVFCVGLYM